MTDFTTEGNLMDSPEVIKAKRSCDTLYTAYQKGQILEAVANVCDCEHNLHVGLGCMPGIIPRDEGALGIKEGTTRDIALISRVNKPVQFIITGFEENAFGQRTAILSRRAVQLKCTEEYCSRLVPGDIVPAKVTHLEKFGAFVDMGAGINSLIPIDMLSVSRISHPDRRVKVGENIRAVVRNTSESKITLSLREMLGTWEENAAKFSVGETVTGIVRSVESYGIFIELTPNLAGLSEPNEFAKTGDTVAVYIKSIIPQKMKIKLTIIDIFDEQQPSVEKIYFPKSSHMDYWRYSPDVCDKVIETIF